MIDVQRHEISLAPNSCRVLLRPFVPGNEGRMRRILLRILSFSEEQVEGELRSVLERFKARHAAIEAAFEQRYRAISHLLPAGFSPSQSRRLFIGSCFSSEYSLESAALFNPSIVPDPDQTNLAPGSLRFILSLRATGEGHISSIEFRSGVIDARAQITLEPVGRLVSSPNLQTDAQYDKETVQQKIRGSSSWNACTRSLLRSLPAQFRRSQLEGRIATFRKKRKTLSSAEKKSLAFLGKFLDSNYDVQFPGTLPLSERALFPVSANESNGIEDARLVRFGDEGTVRYYATYTAYDGHIIQPQLLETDDFLSFRIRTLSGDAVKNKGMALFPRRINGRYAMISRQDGENLFFMSSHNIHIWNEKKLLIGPREPWETVQIGNCGSPIETERGWLLLTHGVGPMRRYCIGALLLDLNDPSKVIGRLKEPLLQPSEQEREGYVPNVLYTCGAIVHERMLVIPYAMSDQGSSFATIAVENLLQEML